jgi:hypothetical protein
MTPSNVISDFMRAKGLDNFWIQSHMNKIQSGLATNKYFIDRVVNLSIRVSKQYNYCTTFVCEGTAFFPDTQEHRQVKLEYNFSPRDHKNAHKISVVLI